MKAIENVISYRWFMALAVAIGFSSGCDMPQTSDTLNDGDDSVTATDVEMQVEEAALARKDNAQTHVSELIDLIEERINKLVQWENQASNIPEEEKLRLEELRNDLERIKRDLQVSLDSLEKISETELSDLEQKLENRIESSRDELDQINEELAEWRDENLEN